MRRINTEANLSRRISATLIDYIPFFILFAVYVSYFGHPSEDGGYEVNGLMAFVPILFWFIFFPVIESFNGQTLGHKIMGIMVITKNGNKIRLGQSLIRRILDPIDLISCFGLIAIITIKNSDHHQRLGDMVAGTIVVGGETKRCPACHTELTLEPKEVLKGRFDCTECGKRTELT